MTKSCLSAAGVAALLALATVPAGAQVTDTSRMARPDTTRAIAPPGQRVSDTVIVQQLMEANQKEIAAADVAIQHAESGSVKDYANTLKVDHTRALQQLQEYAQRHGGMAAGVAGKDYPSDSARTGRDNNRMDQDRVANDSAQPMNRDTTRMNNNVPMPTMDSARADAAQAGNPQDQDFAGKTGKEFDEAFVQNMIAEHQKMISHLRENVIPVIKDSDLKNMVQGMLPTLGNHLRQGQQVKAQLD